MAIDIITSGGTGTGTGADVVLIKSADQSVNNSTTLVNADDLSWSVGANESWAFLFHVFHVAGATDDISLAFTAPSGSTVAFGGSIHLLSEVGDINWAVGSGTKLNVGGFGTATIPFFLSGVIQTAGTAGTAQLQFSQRVATVIDTKLLKGCMIIAYKA